MADQVPSVVLYGPQGSGKTTIAGEVAARLKLPKIVDDDFIAGKPQRFGVLYVTCMEPNIEDRRLQWIHVDVARALMRGLGRHV